jgi:hypothetical protein
MTVEPCTKYSPLAVAFLMTGTYIKPPQTAIAFEVAGWQHLPRRQFASRHDLPARSCWPKFCLGETHVPIILILQARMVSLQTLTGFGCTETPQVVGCEGRTPC